MPDSHRAETNVDVGERDPKQARPCPHLVPRVQQAYEFVDLLAQGVIGDGIKRSSDQVPEGFRQAIEEYYRSLAKKQQR